VIQVSYLDCERREGRGVYHTVTVRADRQDYPVEVQVTESPQGSVQVYINGLLIYARRGGERVHG
jgi:hypothetical protein